MKNKSVFKTLPPEDQKRILDLCATHTYDEVVQILALPRPEGLQLKTSSSALCRFYCAHNDDVRQAAILDQAATALQYLRQRGSGSLRTAILTLLETRVFAALRAQTPIKELRDDLAALKEIHKGFLAEEKWRHEAVIEADKEYAAHLVRSPREESPDFVPCDEQGEPDPAAPPLQPQPDPADGITPELIASVDQRIAQYGPRLVRENATAYGYPRVLVLERIEVYCDRRVALRAAAQPDSPSIAPAFPSNPLGNSTQIH